MNAANGQELCVVSIHGSVFGVQCVAHRTSLVLGKHVLPGMRKRRASWRVGRYGVMITEGREDKGTGLASLA